MSFIYKKKESGGYARVDFLQAVLAERQDLCGMTVTYPRTGDESYTMIIGDEVFKAPNAEKFIPDMGSEVSHLRHIEGKGMPVPAVTYEGREAFFFGMTKVPGFSYSIRDFAILPADVLVQAARDIAQYKVGFAAAYPCKPEGDDRGYVEERLRILQDPLMQEVMMQEGLTFFHERMEDYLTRALERPVLPWVHTDLHPGNIFFDLHQRISGYVDLCQVVQCRQEIDFVLMAENFPTDFIELLGREYAAKAEDGFKPLDILCAGYSWFKKKHVGGLHYWFNQLTKDKNAHLPEVVRGMQAAEKDLRETQVRLEAKIFRGLSC